MGSGFIVGLFGFSLIAYGFAGTVYYQMLDKGIVYLINGGKYTNLPLYLNPLLYLILGLLIVLILLLSNLSKVNNVKRQ